MKTSEAGNGDREFIADNPAVGPPLMLVFRDRLSEAGRENLRMAFEQCWRGDADVPKVAAIENADVFQLLEGRWSKLQ